MTNETNATTDDAIVEAETESPSVSAGTAANATSTAGATSASEKPDASASEQSDTDASASEQSSTASEQSDTDASASEQSSTDSEQPEERARRKAREGFVVSNSMDKTVVVAVIERVRHPKYNKFINQTKRLYAHDEANDVNVGDRVRVMETRPMSKSKRWRVTDVLERAK